MGQLRHWVLAVAWAVVIWIFSTQAFSAEHTGRWILPLLHFFLPRAEAATLNLLHGLIRKCGHVAEYLVFGLFLLRGIRGERHGWQWRWALAALVLAALYATLDEVHQAFVPGRSPEVSDVLLDTAAAAVGQALAWRYGRRGAMVSGPVPGAE